MLTKQALESGWGGPVEIRETHVSLVVLTGNRAYKFKKAVRLPFLDLTDPRRREDLCHEEVRLNRTLCPDVYLGVVPVTREADGRIAVAGKGELLDHAVEMTRLPEERMVDRLLRCGAREEVAAALPELVDRMARFHADAERADEFGTAASVRERVVPILDLAVAHLPPPFVAPLREHVESGLIGWHDLWAERARNGFVRDGHGDLHAANICLAPQGIRIYDRLEFSRAFRCGDVALDLAFLAMSLDMEGASDLSRTLRSLYAERTHDPDFERICAFFRVQRALVRANVTVMRGDAPERVRRYDRLAAGYAAGAAAVLFCGLPATGKSTLAREVAPALRATILRSDLVRKELVGMDPDEHWEGGYDEGPYAPSVTGRVYHELAGRMRADLARGRSVVVDATLSTAAQRATLIDAIGDHPWVLVHLERDEETVRRNLSARAEARDVSDADLAVYLEARGRFEAPVEVSSRRVVLDDGSQSRDDVLDSIVAALLGHPTT